MTSATTTRPEPDQRQERCRALAARIPRLQVASAMKPRPPREADEREAGVR